MVSTTSVIIAVLVSVTLALPSSSEDLIQHITDVLMARGRKFTTQGGHSHDKYSRPSIPEGCDFAGLADPLDAPQAKPDAAPKPAQCPSLFQFVERAPADNCKDFVAAITTSLRDDGVSAANIAEVERILTGATDAEGDAPDADPAEEPIVDDAPDGEAAADEAVTEPEAAGRKSKAQPQQEDVTTPVDMVGITSVGADSADPMPVHTSADPMPVTTALDTAADPEPMGDEPAADLDTDAVAATAADEPAVEEAGTHDPADAETSGKTGDADMEEDDAEAGADDSEAEAGSHPVAAPVASEGNNGDGLADPEDADAEDDHNEPEGADEAAHAHGDEADADHEHDNDADPEANARAIKRLLRKAFYSQDAFGSLCGGTCGRAVLKEVSEEFKTKEGNKRGCSAQSFLQASQLCETVQRPQSDDRDYCMPLVAKKHHELVGESDVCDAEELSAEQLEGLCHPCMRKAAGREAADSKKFNSRALCAKANGDFCYPKVEALVKDAAGRKALFVGDSEICDVRARPCLKRGLVSRAAAHMEDDAAKAAADLGRLCIKDQGATCGSAVFANGDPVELLKTADGKADLCTAFKSASECCLVAYVDAVDAAHVTDLDAFFGTADACAGFDWEAAKGAGSCTADPATSRKLKPLKVRAPLAWLTNPDNKDKAEKPVRAALAAKGCPERFIKEITFRAVGAADDDAAAADTTGEAAADAAADSAAVADTAAADFVADAAAADAAADDAEADAAAAAADEAAPDADAVEAGADADAAADQPTEARRRAFLGAKFAALNADDEAEAVVTIQADTEEEGAMLETALDASFEAEGDSALEELATTYLLAEESALTALAEEHIAAAHPPPAVPIQTIDDAAPMLAVSWLAVLAAALCLLAL